MLGHNAGETQLLQLFSHALPRLQRGVGQEAERDVAGQQVIYKIHGSGARLALILQHAVNIEEHTLEGQSVFEA